MDKWKRKEEWAEWDAERELWAFLVAVGIVVVLVVVGR